MLKNELQLFPVAEIRVCSAGGLSKCYTHINIDIAVVV
jgi:hypothetical protein